MAEPESGQLPGVADLNAASRAEFSAAIARLFETAPAFALRLAAHRPFSSDADLLARAAEVAADLPEAAQVELINAHPRLGAAQAVSEASRREQGADDSDADRELGELQARYEARFGFRYLVFVAGRSRRALIPELRLALQASREAEINRALGDTLAIAADRLARLRGGRA